MIRVAHRSRTRRTASKSNLDRWREPGGEGQSTLLREWRSRSGAGRRTGVLPDEFLGLFYNLYGSGSRVDVSASRENEHDP